MTITTEQLERLKKDAADHGDSELAAVCQEALDGDEGARILCEAVLDEAKR